MPVTINGTQYDGFIDYDRATLKLASLDDWIDWLEYRLSLIILNPLDQILQHNAPHHSVVNGRDMSFFLCGVTLVACAIEGLGHFVTGTDDSGPSFKAWLTKYMPSWDTNVNGISTKDWLWKSARNGLAHELGFKQGGVEIVGSGRIAASARSGQLAMDPDLFYADFKAGAAAFWADLRQAGNTALRTNFSSRFQATFLQP